MTLSDLERWDARAQFFQADLPNYALTVCLRKSKFGTVARGEGRISRAQLRPNLKRWRLSASQILAFFPNYAYTRRTTKFVVITCMERDVLLEDQPRPHP